MRVAVNSSTIMLLSAANLLQLLCCCMQLHFKCYEHHQIRLVERSTPVCLASPFADNYPLKPIKAPGLNRYFINLDLAYAR